MDRNQKGKKKSEVKRKEEKKEEDAMTDERPRQREKRRDREKRMRGLLSHLNKSQNYLVLKDTERTRSHFSSVFKLCSFHFSVGQSFQHKNKNKRRQ